jgi:DNA-binding cell septation regulator SpoVG
MWSADSGHTKISFFEIVSPITGKARKMLEERVLDEYERVTGEALK